MAKAYYVVNKETGRVVAGNEYREDANDAREDSPLPKSQTEVLTAAGVRRKYGKIVWERGTRRNGFQEPRSKPDLSFSSIDLKNLLNDVLYSGVSEAIEDAYGSNSLEFLTLAPIIEESSDLDYTISHAGSMVEIFRPPSERDRGLSRNEYVLEIRPTEFTEIGEDLIEEGFSAAYVLAEWDGKELIPVQVKASIY